MTYKRDNRTRFWVAIHDDGQGGKFIYVASCLKDWFSRRFPRVVSASLANWEISTHGKDFIHIPPGNCGLVDWDHLGQVLSFAGNECFWPKIPGHEIGDLSLSYCVVGDYTQCPDEQDRQTTLGRIFHAAKYERVDSGAANAGVDSLASHVCRMLSLFEGCYDRNRAVVASIPVSQTCRAANLGRQIASRVASREGLPFLESIVTCDKPQFKGLRLDEKLVAWEGIYRGGNVSFDVSLSGSDVILVDDLYQSGTTMWAFARYLKSLGVRSVIGLACVKSLRDTDNVSG